MRSILTTVLDVLGAVLLVVAAAEFAADLEVTAVVRWCAVAGAGFLFVSWVADGAPLPWRKGRS